MPASSTVSDRDASRRNLPGHPVFLPRAFPADFGNTSSRCACLAIIGEFLPRYGYGARVLRAADPATGCPPVRDEARLRKLGMDGIPHGKFPAGVAYSSSRLWLYLIETTHPPGPIPPSLYREPSRLTARCKAGILFITAYTDRASLRKPANDIPWETDVWIADEPGHMIHFNGNRHSPAPPAKSSMETRHIHPAATRQHGIAQGGAPGIRSERFHQP